MRTSRSSFPRHLVHLFPALFLEVINFWVIGYPAGPHPISEAAHHPAVALQWYILHLPGIIIGDRIIYVREHQPLESAVLFLAGLIDTALLLRLALWLAKLARRTLHKLSSPRKQLA